MATATINTTRFGELEIDEDRLISFAEPILGFERDQQFAILDHSEDSPFKWLQAADSPDLAFVITNPKLFGIDYEFAVPQDIADRLSLTKAEDALVVTIVNIPQGRPGDMTANLLGPIVINQAKKIAMQVVLTDSNFSTKTRLIPEEVANPGSQQASSVTANNAE